MQEAARLITIKAHIPFMSYSNHFCSLSLSLFMYVHCLDCQLRARNIHTNIPHKCTHLVDRSVQMDYNKKENITMEAGGWGAL